MPRRPRLAAGDLAYHVLNRRVGRLSLFEKPADYVAFVANKRGRESFLDTRFRY
jgi:putative transposase